MKFIFCLFLSFQLALGAFAQELGESRPFKASGYLQLAHAKIEAQNFKRAIESGLKKLQSKELADELDSLKLDPAKKKELGQLIAASRSGALFSETGPGAWAARVEGRTISFTLIELYQGRLKIDGKTFVFKNIPYSEVVKKLEAFEEPQKTSWINSIFNNTFGVNEAHAVLPVVIIGVVVGVIALYALYQLKWKPEATVEKLDALKTNLEKLAGICEESKSNEESYQETFRIANSVSERTTLNSVSSPEDALMLVLKEQISQGDQNEEDCYKLMHQAGEKLDVDFPLPTQSEIQRMSFNGGSMRMNKKTDLKGALYNLCQAYNSFGGCMSQFVGSHVNSSDMNIFKENARRNFDRWRRSNKSTRQ